MKTFVSKPLELPRDREAITRADLVFYDVDHSGPSYRARVFLDNPSANPDTPLEPESGYVGSFTVFGHAASVKRVTAIRPGPRRMSSIAGRRIRWFPSRERWRSRRR